jgi:hypothetical protein
MKCKHFARLSFEVRSCITLHYARMLHLIVSGVRTQIGSNRGVICHSRSTCSPSRIRAAGAPNLHYICALLRDLRGRSSEKRYALEANFCAHILIPQA